MISDSYHGPFVFRKLTPTTIKIFTYDIIIIILKIQKGR